MFRPNTGLLAAAAVFLISGCAQVKYRAARGGGDASAFFHEMGQIQMTSAHLGQLAQQRASGENVRTFASRLESDSQDAYRRLGELARHKNVEIPKALDAEHQNIVQRLENLSGTDFDREFLQRQAESSRRMVEELQRHDWSGDQPMGEYALDMLPRAGGHLAVAQTLSDGMLGAPPAAEQATTVLPPSPAASREHVAYGTVTRYQPEQILELRLDGRPGIHHYDLAAADYTIQLPADVRQGTRVRVVERMEANQRASVRIEPQDRMGMPAD